MRQLLVLILLSVLCFAAESQTLTNTGTFNLPDSIFENYRKTMSESEYSYFITYISSSQYDNSPKGKLLAKWCEKNNCVPSEGMADLLRAVNPELDTMNTISLDYKLKSPAWPRVKRKYWRQYKKIIREQAALGYTTIKRAVGFAMTASVPENEADIINHENEFGLSGSEKEYPFLFTISRGDKIIENSYTIKYVFPRDEKDTTMYKAFGPASTAVGCLGSAKYRIIVYDRNTNQRVPITDDYIYTIDKYKHGEVIAKYKEFKNAHRINLSLR